MNINDLQSNAFAKNSEGKIGLRVILKDWGLSAPDFSSLGTGEVGEIKQALDTGLLYRFNGTIWDIYDPPVTKSISYNIDGTVNVVSDSQGTKTMSYSVGKLAGITGTGRYKSKTMNYTGNNITSITVS